MIEPAAFDAAEVAAPLEPEVTSPGAAHGEWRKSLDSDTRTATNQSQNLASLSLACAACGADMVRLYNDLHLPLTYETWWGADGQPHCAPLKNKATLRAEQAIEKCPGCREAVKNLDAVVCSRLKERKLDDIRARQEFRAGCRKPI